MIGRMIKTVLGWLAGLVAALVVLSFAWVVLYRFVPPPITWLQARDAINGQHVEREWVPLTAMTAGGDRGGGCQFLPPHRH